ncbi:MAG: CCA tRNA nucleotidyltransferase [Rhodospirillaceae bacterium]|nr:CCA tRNA nucleotidyltransferase [Rhodospirillaceae bacterium]
MIDTIHPAWMDEAGVQAVLSALGAPEVDVRVVGGCVRDALAGRAVADIDVATPDVPNRVLARLQAAGLKAIPTGLAHGTVTAVGGRRNIEITTLRRDTSCDGRHADVEFTSDWREDAQRRDFTINAMSLKPDGALFDYFGGRQDLAEGRIRFVGAPADRIREDYLRILRLFRFHAHYGRAPLDAATLAACAELKEGLSMLSGERVQHELKRLLAAPRPAAALEAMARVGVLAKILPEVTSAEAMAKLIAVEKEIDVMPHWLRRLAVLLPEGAYVMPLGARLRMANRDRDDLAALVAPEPRITASMPNTDIDLLLYRLGRDRILDRAMLAAARGGNMYVWLPVLHRARDWVHRPMPLTGDDVMALGIAPGPLIGHALDLAEKVWAQSGFTATREALLKSLQKA